MKSALPFSRRLFICGREVCLERYFWQVDYKLLREESKFSHGLGERQ